VNFARCSGVIVDVCRSHGTWFDAHELHRIVHFIRDGGMDRARAKEKADIVMERHRLQSARTGLGPGHSPAACSPVGDFGVLGEVVSASAQLLTSFLDD